MALTNFIIVTGVGGIGKSTVAARLATDLCVSFIEGDDHHLPDSIAKMARGVPLTDEDRWPWLDAVATAANAAANAGNGGVVIACSALKRRYRNQLAADLAAMPFFVHLHAPRSLVARRLAGRKNHFFATSLLESQYSDLEMCDDDERHCLIDASCHSDNVYAAVRRALAHQKKVVGQLSTVEWRRQTSPYRREPGGAVLR